jgi:hypothetical protein
MQTATVAVDPDLSAFWEALRAAGYRVVSTDAEDAEHADAVVVDGMDDHLMGIETALTLAPVIDADGLTADQVVQAVRERLGSA